jgi:hypothetical protein
MFLNKKNEERDKQTLLHQEFLNASIIYEEKSPKKLPQDKNVC